MAATNSLALQEKGSRANNFNLLRLVAASLVIVSHSFGLRHPPGFYGENSILNSQIFGWAAVNVFFVMSGYLIAKAAWRDPDPVRFIRNRVLRIYPGLIVCTLLSVLILGLIFRPAGLAGYLGQSATLRFLIGNASAVWPQYTLPGVFTANAYADGVNGSLWSLRFEILCYAAVAVLLVTGALARPRLVVLLFGGLLALYVGGAVLAALGHFPHSSTLRDLHRLVPCFGLGAAYAFLDRRVRIRAWHVVLAGAGFALSCAVPVPALQAACATLALALATFWFAFLQYPWLSRFRTGPDWSYGVYIYAFPIQQLLMAFLPGLHPAVHCVAAFGLVLIPASLSWHFIEKPALALKDARLHWPRLGRPPTVEPAAVSGVLDGSVDLASPSGGLENRA